jgi:hypothetical protein
MSLALNRRGLAIADVAAGDVLPAPYISLATLALRERTTPDPLLDNVFRRMSWRGTFAASPEDDAALSRLSTARDDVVIIRGRDLVADIATWADRAEYSFVRGADYRHELLEWMRLSPRHPLYLHNGLNRDALAMNALEATAARFVLGGLFPTLDRLGLATSLLSDRAKTSSAAAIVLFCRPTGEDPLVTGRHFYRVWLEIDRAGLSACPISALADHAGFNGELKRLGKVSAALRLVNVFRTGRPSKPYMPRHFRLPVDELIV